MGWIFGIPESCSFVKHNKHHHLNYMTRYSLSYESETNHVSMSTIKRTGPRYYNIKIKFNQSREAKGKQPDCHAFRFGLAKTPIKYTTLSFGQWEARCMTIIGIVYT